MGFRGDGRWCREQLSRKWFGGIDTLVDIGNEGHHEWYRRRAFLSNFTAGIAGE